jgi:signal peptidase
MISNKKLRLIHSSKAKVFFLIALVMVIYAIENFFRPQFISGMVFTYIVTPLLWLGVACIVFMLPRVRSKGLLKHRKHLKWMAVYYAVIFQVVLIFAGIIDGFGKSPYNHSMKWIAINTVFIGMALIGRELVRNYMVNSFADKENYFVFIPIALFMTLASISFNSINVTGGYEDTVKYMAEYFLPSFSQNLFAVFLVYWGGPLTSIIYLGIINAFQWYLPILPGLQWITTALIGTLCPIFFLISMQRTNMEMSKEIRIRDKCKDKPIGWIATSVFSIAIIWFAVGVFPIYPSVIATGSMEPGINVGDVIIVDKSQAKDVELNDVIQFRKEDILISHRIIGIVEEERGISYRTKGDNNPSQDMDLVGENQVKGKVIYVAPKIGLPTLYMKANNKWH